MKLITRSGIALFAIIAVATASFGGSSKGTQNGPFHYKDLTVSGFKNFSWDQRSPLSVIHATGAPRIKAILLGKRVSVEGGSLDAKVDSKVGIVRNAHLAGGTLFTLVGQDKNKSEVTTTITSDSATMTNKGTVDDTVSTINLIGTTKFTSDNPGAHQTALITGSGGTFVISSGTGQEALLRTAEVDGPVRFKATGPTTEKDDNGNPVTRSRTVFGSADHMSIKRDGRNYVVSLTNHVTFSIPAEETNFDGRTVTLTLDENFNFQGFNADAGSQVVIPVAALKKESGGHQKSHN